MATIDEVRAVVGEALQLGERVEAMDASTPLLGAIPEFDAMSVVNVVTALEEHFGIRIADDEIGTATFATLDSLGAFVERKIDAGRHDLAPVPFFLQAAGGARFCVLHPAAGPPRGAVVFVHPFAEEMNRSRRMAALQSRMLAARGFAVLQIDLFGCGDSDGEFGDADWDTWRRDVALAVDWLAQRAQTGVALWGLRLGALLALDAAADCAPAPERFVLWQPVVTGEQFLTQFLRLRVAGDLIAAGSAQTSTQHLRHALDAGERIEVAGYDLAPTFARAIDRLKLADLAPRPAPVHWFEVVPQAGRGLPPAAGHIAEAWTRAGVPLTVQCVPGQPFWSTLEITECPALVAATTRALDGAMQ